MRRFLLLLSAALPLLSHADEAAPSLKGTWRAYVTTQGVVTGRTDTRYVFGDLGWAIRDATGTRRSDTACTRRGRTDSRGCTAWQSNCGCAQ